MDITERKQAEEKFRLATEASPSGIILVNDRGHIVLVNSQIEKLFGYQREELVGNLWRSSCRSGSLVSTRLIERSFSLGLWPGRWVPVGNYSPDERRQ